MATKSIQGLGSLASEDGAGINQDVLANPVASGTRSFGVSDTGFASGMAAQMLLGGTANSMKAMFGAPVIGEAFHGYIFRNSVAASGPGVTIKGQNSGQNVQVLIDATGATVGNIYQGGLAEFVHTTAALSGTPTSAPGAAAGTGGTTTVGTGDNDEAFMLTIVTGSSPVTGTLATITFAKAFRRRPVVVYSMAGGILPASCVIVASASSGTGCTITVAGAPLAASQGYTICVLCRE